MSEGEPTEVEKTFLANEARRQRQTAPSVATHTVSSTPAAEAGTAADEHPILPPPDKAPSQIPQGAEILPEEKKQEEPVKKRHSIFGK